MFKYNFYKKKYKKLKKILNIAIEKNIIYVVDNIGYLYAINYKDRNLLWAKNFRVPFRSNIKISEEAIIVSDINNYIYFINKLTGEKSKILPTEEATVKNEFMNRD